MRSTVERREKFVPCSLSFGAVFQALRNHARRVFAGAQLNVHVLNFFACPRDVPLLAAVRIAIGIRGFFFGVVGGRATADPPGLAIPRSRLAKSAAQ